MLGKADNQKLYRKLKTKSLIQLVIPPRKGMDKSQSRRPMIEEMLTKQNMKNYKERLITIEQMQELLANIFDLDRCWMRGNANNRRFLSP